MLFFGEVKSRNRFVINVQKSWETYNVGDIRAVRRYHRGSLEKPSPKVLSKVWVHVRISRLSVHEGVQACLIELFSA